MYEQQGIMAAKNMNEAMTKIDEITNIMSTFGKIGLDRFTYIIPIEISRDVRQLLDQAGIDWKLAKSDTASHDITIFIPERYRKKR